MLTEHMTPSVSAPRATQPISVLLVDDDEWYASFVRSVFDNATGLEVALHHLPRLADVLPHLEREPCSVILLDANLPDGDGLQWLLRHRPNLQAAVIVLTSDPDCGFEGEAGPENLLKSEVEAWIELPSSQWNRGLPACGNPSIARPRTSTRCTPASSGASSRILRSWCCPSTIIWCTAATPCSTRRL
jgi:CheY-like chemotaxis protein